MRALRVIALAGTLLMACGPSEAPVATPAATTADAPSATTLTITVDPGGGEDVQQYSLTCDPSGGDHPDPDGACSALADAADAEPNPLDPVPADVACTEIYGGDQTAVVEGTLAGEPVRAELSRTNGCEIDRWDALVALLVEPGGVNLQ